MPRTRHPLLDRDLEAFLAVAVPTDLAFEVDEWRQSSASEDDRRLHAAQKQKADDSGKRFIAYYQEKTRLAQALVSRLEATAAARDSVQGTVAATARLALAKLHYADQVLQIETKVTAGPAAVEAYCGAMHGQADRIVDDGVKALSLCLARASVGGAFGGAARYCEAQLQRRAPLAFPPLQELFAAGQALDPEAETIPVQAQPYDFVELTSRGAPLPGQVP